MATAIYVGANTCIQYGISRQCFNMVQAIVGAADLVNAVLLEAIVNTKTEIIVAEGIAQLRQ